MVHVSSPDLTESTRLALQGIGAQCHTVRLKRSGINPFADLVYTWDLFRIMRQYHIEYAISYTVKPNVFGAAAAWLAQTRFSMMVTGLGLSFIDRQTSSLKRFIAGRVARALYRFASTISEKVVFQNPDDAEEFVARGCLRDLRKILLVNGSGVDLNRFEPRPLPSAAVFLLIARLLVSKGVREYGIAVETLRSEGVQARFLLAGPMENGPDAISVAELGTLKEQGVEYLGELKDVRSTLEECSVYVLPSWREGTPRTVLEAMALGRPIITTDVPGCRETTVDGYNGFLVPEQDPISLARAMTTLALNPEERQKMGQASLDRVRARYSVHDVNQCLITGLMI